MVKTIFILFWLVAQIFCSVGVQASSQEIKQLSILIQKKQLLKKQILALEKELKSPELIGQTKRAIRLKIKKRNQELTKTQNYFRYISSGLNSDNSQTKIKKDLLKEFQKIVEPLISTLSQISERPRKIGKIKNEIEQISEREVKLQQAIQRVDKLLQDATNSIGVEQELQNLKKEFLQESATLALTKKQLQIDLDELAQTNQSLLSIWSKTLFHFFKTKGINLFLAFFSFLTVWVILIRIKNQILEMSFLEDFPWAVRPLNVLYTSLIFLFALIVAILVLYVRNDWFLVTLILIFITGFVWSIKQWIPQFIHKGKLLLNLGPIREHELVVWKGVPYKIVRLSYFSILENTMLAGGRLRISIDELANLQSRPILEEEIWFPCSIGEFVQLQDGVFGEVIRLTPEYVVIRSYKMNEHFYRMEQFLAQNPQNFSKGFIIEKQFALPLSAQQKIANGLSEQLEKYLFEKLQEFSVLSIQIIIDELNRGVIGFSIFANCPGGQAKNKIFIEKQVVSYLFHFLIENKIELPAESMVINLQKS